VIFFHNVALTSSNVTANAVYKDVHATITRKHLLKYFL